MNSFAKRKLGITTQITEIIVKATIILAQQKVSKHIYVIHVTFFTKLKLNYL